MRVVLCDEGGLLQEMVEALVARMGHEVSGVADNSVDAVHLLEAARPDAVILDLALDFNSDFDAIEAAISVGARVIVFSHTADAAVLDRYTVRPTVVPKPDLTALEHALDRLDVDDEAGAAVERERRRNPQRAVSGPPPTSVSDAHAFFEAVNSAQAGDAMLSLAAPDGGEALAVDLIEVIRGDDRLLAFHDCVRFVLPGGGGIGVRSLLQRIGETGLVSPSTAAHSVVVRLAENGADAFERLKRDGEPQRIPPASPGASVG